MRYRFRTWSGGLLVALSYLAASACSDSSSTGSNSADGGAGGSGGTTTGSGGANSSAGGAGGSSASGGSSANSGGETSSGGGTSSGGSGGSSSTAVGGTGAGGADGTTDAGGSAGMAGATSEAGLSVDDFCELLQDRARSWLRVCRSFGDSIGWWGTQRIDRFCTSGRAAIEAGRLEYDPVQAQACADLSVGDCNDIEAFAYSVDVIPQASWLQSDACRGVVTGTVELGGECHAYSTDYARECVEGFCTNACPGTCSEFLAIGDTCVPSASGCDPETSFCSSTELECQAYVEPGGDCAAAQCAAGSFCRYNESNDTSSCVLRVAQSGACDPDLEQCEAGLVCYEDACVDRVPLGAVCNSVAQCPAGTYCDGNCRDYVAVDGDCSTGGLCVAGSTCDGSTCVALSEEGDPCPCQSGLYCGPGDLCAPAAAVDEPCGELVDSEPVVPCTLGLSCVPSALEGGVPTLLHCQEVSGLGDSCMPQNTSQCPWPWFCHPQSFTCVERAGDNASCNVALPRDSCQDGFICICTDNCEAPVYEATGACTALVANGMDCTSSSQCESGNCDGTCQAPTLCY